jgi:hypothetical protein
MSDRRYIPPKRQILGEVPPCDPYYDQRSLPRSSTPGMLSIPAASGGGGTSQTRERFHKFGSIIAPVAGTLNAPITSYTVPDGHQAAVVGLMLKYSPATPPGGFVEGDSTLLFFSLRLNGSQFVSDYDSIPNDLGDFLSGPWPLPGKLNLFAADLLEILVTVPVGSTIDVAGNNRFHGHLIGYYWPNQG